MRGLRQKIKTGSIYSTVREGLVIKNLQLLDHCQQKVYINDTISFRNLARPQPFRGRQKYRKKWEAQARALYVHWLRPPWAQIKVRFISTSRRYISETVKIGRGLKLITNGKLHKYFDLCKIRSVCMISND